MNDSEILNKVHIKGLYNSYKLIGLYDNDILLVSTNDDISVNFNFTNDSFDVCVYGILIGFYNKRNSEEFSLEIDYLQAIKSILNYLKSTDIKKELDIRSLNAIKYENFEEANLINNFINRLI